MATREAVYEKFGQAAHFAQLLEIEMGTALLAIDALDTQSYLMPDADKYLRLKAAIDSQTLGRSLGQIKMQLQLPGDVASEFESALEKRNVLIHRFYARHGLNFMGERGRDEMLNELVMICDELNRAWLSAQRIAGLLVQGIDMFRRFRDAQPKA